MKRKFGLLPRVLLAIGLGIACGCFTPGWVARVALTFNAGLALCDAQAVAMQTERVDVQIAA